MDTDENQRIYELIRESEKMEKTTGTRASRLKVLSIILSIAIIFSGGAIATVAPTADFPYKSWLMMSLGFLIAGLKSFTSVYKLDNKAVTDMQTSIKMRQFIRKLRKLKRKRMSDNDIEDELDKLGEEFDLLKLSAFSNDTLRKVITEKREPE